MFYRMLLYKELTKLRRERDDQDSILKCIEDIKEKLEKYDCLRSFSQPMDGSITRIEKNLRIQRKTVKKQRR